MSNLKKNTFWNVLGTTINAFVSLVLMIIVTRINGINDAGIFSFAFSVATLLNIVGVYAGRIFQVTDNSDVTNKDYYINRIITCSIMAIIAVGFVCIREYSIQKITIILLLCFLKMMEAFADVIYGYLQKNDKLYLVGISLVLKGIIGTFFFLIIDIVTSNYIKALISFVLIYLIIMIFFDFKKVDLKTTLSCDSTLSNIKKIFISGFPTFCSSFFTMYIINSSKYAIDSLSKDEVQAIFGIIIMPATMMILITQFIIHPFLNIINEYVKSKDYKKLKSILIKMSLFLLIIGIIIILLCHFIGIYIIGWVYNINLIPYRIYLDIILLGAIFYAITSVINTILIAMRYTVIQVIVYIFLTVESIIVAYILVKYYSILGASLNYLITMFSCLIAFIITFNIILKKRISVRD